MSPRGTRQKPAVYKVLGKIRNISPDDIRAKLLLRDQQRVSQSMKSDELLREMSQQTFMNFI